MKHILTAITLALASCASAPATASTIHDIGRKTCDAVSEMARQFYNARGSVTHRAALDTVGTDSPYIVSAINMVYGRDFVTDQVAARAVNTNCMMMVHRQIVEVLQ